MPRSLRLPRRVAPLLGLAWMIAGAASAQTTTYAYIGDPYTTAQPPYAVGQRLTGTLTLASPLPRFLPPTDLRPALAAFQFSDGVETRTLSDSFVCRFEVATDGVGTITEWNLSLRRFPFEPGEPHHAIDSSGQVGVVQGIDLVGRGTAPADPCAPMALAPQAAAPSQGSWSSDQPLPADPTVYAFTGDPYTSADPPYAIGGRLTGTLTTAAPLPPFLPRTDVTPALVAFAFDDGVETRTLADSFLCRFEVATDGAGNITEWAILLRRFPYNPGDPQHSVESDGEVGLVEGIDQVGSGAAAADPCGPVSLSPQAVAASQGSWISDHPQPGDPTVYTYTGDPYASADPPYAIGGRLTGLLALAAPLPAFLPRTDVTAAIVDFSFTDGVEARTLGDSFVCRFEVATDGAGDITEWVLSLRRYPYAPGDPHHAIDSAGQVGPIQGIDQAGTGAAPADPCGPMSLESAGTAPSQGTWIADRPLQADPTTYVYSGDPYSAAEVPYSLGGSLRGSVRLAGRLPPFLPLTDLRPALVDFAFDDGVETRRLADSFLCRFEVATDGAGEITTWRLALRRFPLDPGDPLHAIESAGQPGVVYGTDWVGSGAAPADPCDPMALSPYATTAGQGVWSAQSATSLVEVPALGPVGIALFGAALAALGARILARRRSGP